ncbi:MAG: methyltransferase domain-containing protein [Actinobacteria bacterium]|nr:methyltransferase domain-containing protein [Actinomycetota bacterium]
MSILCCPACRGALDEADEGLACAACGVVYRVERCSADFTREEGLDEAATRQRDIYEGRLAGQGVGAFLDPEVARNLTDTYVEAARSGYVLAPNWLGLEYRRALERLAPFPGERVLDVGCSTGSMLSAIGAAFGTTGTGIDFSVGAVRLAVEYNPLGNEYHVADALNLPFADGSFDVVVSFGVIEHVSDPERMVGEVVRVLAPGGRALIYTTCRRSRWTWHWWQRLTSGGRYHLGVDDLAGHDPETFLLPEELEGMFLASGMERAQTVVVHTLYSLMLDEAFPGMVPALLAKPRLLSPVSRAIELADALLNDRAYGNEFLALAWKEAS